jgi:hypothetical protein
MGQDFSNMAQGSMAGSPFKSFFDQFSSFSNKQEQKKEE